MCSKVVDAVINIIVGKVRKKIIHVAIKIGNMVINIQKNLLLYLVEGFGDGRVNNLRFSIRLEIFVVYMRNVRKD